MNPQLPPMPQEEFVSGPEITEAEDPSPQDEAALKKEGARQLRRRELPRRRSYS